jgi:hypothetical protein
MQLLVAWESIMGSLVWLLVPLTTVLVTTFVISRRQAPPTPLGSVLAESEEGLPTAAPRTGTAGRRPAPPNRRRAYYGAVFEPGPDCCRPAWSLRGKRYLAAEAPLVPLPICDKDKCECMLVATKDRRSGLDRRVVNGTAEVVDERRSGIERRRGQDRRKF